MKELPLDVDARMQTDQTSDSLTASTRDERATHTPGPWRVDDGDTTLRVRSTQAPWYCVALVTGGVDSEDVEMPDGAVYQANARLLAAAPDILDALKAAVIALELSDEDRFNSATLPKLRSAIAKAEGSL